MTEDDELHGKSEINILLVDDDKDDCYLFREALEELGLPTHLTTLHNGEQLMEQLDNDSFTLPDILFLDLNMPRKNGFTCLEEMKRNEKLSSLNVIIYSTSFDTKIADQLYKNGANHYICKPADFSMLKKVIHQAITLITNGIKTKPDRENFLLG